MNRRPFSYSVPISLLLIASLIYQLPVVEAARFPANATISTETSGLGRAEDAPSLPTAVPNSISRTSVTSPAYMPFFAPSLTATLADDIGLGTKKSPADTITYTATTATGFNATGGGTVSVKGTINSLAATTGRAINIDGVTADVTVQDVSVSGGGTTTGVWLKNTGASGQFLVTGNGTTADSGGITQNIDDGGSNATIGTAPTTGTCFIQCALPRGHTSLS